MLPTRPRDKRPPVLVVAHAPPPGCHAATPAPFLRALVVHLCPTIVLQGLSFVTPTG
jgi:hypothetical protein